MPSRLTSNHFVGRVGELAELELAVREASAGRPTLVLLGGDSGVGKTRLVGELEHRLAAGPTTTRRLILRGDGVEQADGELPYAPLLSALRPLVRERHPALQDLSPGGRAAAGDDPPRAGGRRAARRAPGPPTASCGCSRRCWSCSTASARPRPLVLILEDMHWADRSTRAFVGFLARSLRQERVLRAPHLPHRRAAPPPPAAAAAVRARAARARAPHRAGAVRPRRAARGARRHPRRRARRRRCSSGCSRAARATRSTPRSCWPPGSTAAAPRRRACATRSWCASSGSRRTPSAWRARSPSARALDEAMLAAVTGLDRDALQDALREAVAEQVLVAGADGQLRLPPRAAARGALRRPAARRARRAAPRAGARARAALRRRRRSRARARLGDRRPLRRRRGPARARCAARIDAARGRRTSVYAYGEAADLTERALELWPRVDDARAGGRARSRAPARRWPPGAPDHRTTARAARCSSTRRCASSTPTRDPARYAGLLAQQARDHLGAEPRRGGAGDRRARAGHAPADDPGGVTAAAAGLAGAHALPARPLPPGGDRGRGRAAGGDRGRRPARRDRGAQHAGDGPGVAGRRRQGSRRRCERAIDLARGRDDFDSLATAYSNLADMLSLPGGPGRRSTTAQEGLAATPATTCAAI